MIKQTFYNLNEEKKGRIIAAAKKEFSKVLLHDAKISNIIDEAKIPRGSFYQYFDTLNDVFIAMMQSLEMEKINALNEKALRSDDIFELSEQMLEHEYFYFKDMNHTLLINIFRLSEIQQINPEETKGKFKNTQYMTFLSELDFSRFRNSDHQDIFIIVQMIFHVLSETVKTAILKGLSFEETKQLFNKQLDYIKYGVLRESEEKR